MLDKKLKISIFKDIYFYGIISILTRLISFLLFPSLARSLGVKDFGLIDIILMMIQGGSILYTLGIDSVIYRYFNEKDTHKERVELITQGVFTQFFTTIIITAFMLFYYFLVDCIKIDSEIYQKYFPYLIISIPCASLLATSEAVLRITFSRSKFFIVSVGYQISLLVMTLCLIKINGMSIKNFMVGYFLCTFLFMIISINYIRKFLFASDYGFISKKLFKYAIPIGLVSFIAYSQGVFERYWILSRVGAFDMGLYAAASKICLLIAMPVSIIQVALLPYILKNYKNSSAIKVMNDVLVVILFFLALIYCYLINNSMQLIGILATVEYADAANIIPSIACALMLNGISTVTGVGTIISNRTQWRFYLTIISYGFFIVTLINLTESYGALGVAYSLLISRSIFLMLDTIVSNRLYSVSWNYSSLCIYVILIIVFMFAEANFSVSQENKILIMISEFVIVSVWAIWFSNWRASAVWIRLIKSRIKI